MLNRRRLPLAAVLALAALFLFTMTRSILRRANTANNYPAYSSLNNAGSGTKAYFDALARLGFAPSRNFKLLPKLAGSHAAIFYAGPELWSFRFSDQKELEQFELLAQRGARVILALDPEAVIETPQAKPKPPKPPSDIRPPEDNLERRWHIHLAHTGRAVSPQNREFLARLGMLPVNWQFSSWSSDWAPSHARDGAPLFLERAFGPGSIVLIANSKLFTNRELLLHPDADVLASAPGPYRSIIFDENHLGLADTGTVVGLAAAHGLAWMLVGFVVLAALYVWRSSTSFVPPPPSASDAAVGGRDAHLALSHLLMQSVPSRSVLRVAGEEWNRSATLQARATRPLTQAELNLLDRLPPADAVAQYRALAARLHPK